MAKLKVTTGRGIGKTQVFLDDKDITNMLCGLDISIHTGEIDTATLTFKGEIEFDGLTAIYTAERQPRSPLKLPNTGPKYDCPESLPKVIARVIRDSVQQMRRPS